MIPLVIPAALSRYVGLAKVAGVVLVLIAAWWWWSSHNQAQRDIGRAEVVAEFRTQQETAAAAQRIREAGNFRKWERALDERIETEKRLAAARAAARDAEQRLQHTRADFDRRLDAANREAAVAAARTVAGLFGQCVARYRALGEAADGHLADARACAAAWPE